MSCLHFYGIKRTPLQFQTNQPWQRLLRRNVAATDDLCLACPDLADFLSGSGADFSYRRDSDPALNTYNLFTNFLHQAFLPKDGPRNLL
jgi:hypothetical protein